MGTLNNLNTVKFSEVRFSEGAKELARLFLETTDYRVCYPDYKHSRDVSYLYISDGMNIVTVGKTSHVPWYWYASFPIKPSSETGSSVPLPISDREIESAEEVVEVAKQYMGNTITPGPRHCEGVFGNRTFDNHERSGVPLVEIVKD